MLLTEYRTILFRSDDMCGIKPIIKNMCFRLYLVVWQIHYLPIYYYTEHLFTCQELFRKRKDGVGFHRHHEKLITT